MAAPIGVSPCACSQGGWNTAAGSNSVATWTGPKVMHAISTRFGRQLVGDELVAEA